MAEKMGKQFLKIYGERNTGSRYFSRLLKLNMDVSLIPGTVPDDFIHLINERVRADLLPEIANELKGADVASFYSRETLKDIYFSFSFGKTLGWKHSLLHEESLPSCDPDGKRVIYLTITKNPYSWAMSLYKRPHEYKGDASNIEAFLSSSWATVERENAATRFLNPIDMWNQKNRSYWLPEGKFSVLNLRYEDIVSDPEGVVDKVSKIFSIPLKSGGFKNLIESTKEKGKSYEDYNRYYLNEEWKAELDSNIIAIINRYLDDDVVMHYGYEKLT